MAARIGNFIIFLILSVLTLGIYPPLLFRHQTAREH